MVAKLVFLCALLGAASAQEPGKTFLTHEELKALVSGTTTVRFTRDKAKGMGVYTQDGIARLDGGSWSAKGNWRIDGNKFCTRYPGIRRGYESCYNFQKTGENFYTLYDTEDGTPGTWLIEK